MTNYVVYAHIRDDSAEIFYIGSGSEKRPCSTGGRNKYWREVVKETTYSIVILHRTNLKAEAYRNEERRLKNAGLWKRRVMYLLIYKPPV